MATYNLMMSIKNGTITVKNNSNMRLMRYGFTSNYNTEIGPINPGETRTYSAKSYIQLFYYKEHSLESPGKIPLYAYQKISNYGGNDGVSFSYIDNKGQTQWYVSDIQSANFSNNVVSDTSSPGGLSTLHIDDTRVEQINYNNKSYTTFPVDIPLDPNVKTMTVIGKTFNVQLDNELNIVRVKDGQTEYRQFPATVMVGENKTLQLYGKEDPEITIDYTGTQDPVITNTPATPPPVV